MQRVALPNASRERQPRKIAENRGCRSRLGQKLPSGDSVGGLTLRLSC